LATRAENQEPAMKKRRFPNVFNRRILSCCIAFLCFALPFLPIGRRQILGVYLHTRSAPITLDEEQRLREWISRSLGAVRDAPALCVNALPGRDEVGLVVIDGRIPLVTPALPSNAAYDPDLRVIFLDIALCKLILDHERHDRRDFVLFVLLHELGHHALGHSRLGRLQAHGGRVGPRAMPATHDLERAADAWAVPRLVEICRKNSGDDPLDFFKRLMTLVEELLITGAQGQVAMSLALESTTHPILLSRAASIAELIGTNKDIPPEARETCQVVSEWLRLAAEDASWRVIAELLPPGNTGVGFATGCTGPTGPAFVLTDGRICTIGADDWPRLLAGHPSQTVGTLNTTALGAPMPDPPIIELINGCQFWYMDGTYYLLQPFGRLSRTTAAAREFVRFPGRLEALQGRAVDRLIPTPNRSGCWIVAMDFAKLFIIFLDLRNRASPTARVAAELPRTRASDLASRVAFADSHGDRFFFLVHDGNLGKERLVRLQVLDLGRWPEQSATPAPVMTFAARYDVTRAGVLIDPSSEIPILFCGDRDWRSVTVSRMNKRGAADEVARLKTYIAKATRPGWSWDVGISSRVPSGRPRLFWHPDRRHAILRVNRLGLFVWDSVTGNFVTHGGIRDEHNVFGIEGAPLLVATGPAHERAIVWHLGDGLR
jgi:hypothetical protein